METKPAWWNWGIWICRLSLPLVRSRVGLCKLVWKTFPGAWLLCAGTGMCRSCSSIAISRKQEKGKKQPTCASQRRLHWLGLHLPSLLASLVLGGKPCFSESAASGSVLLCSEQVDLTVCSLKYLEICCGLEAGNLILVKENGSQIQWVYQAHGDHSAVEGFSFMQNSPRRGITWMSWKVWEEPCKMWALP